MSTNARTVRKRHVVVSRRFLRNMTAAENALKTVPTTIRIGAPYSNMSTEADAASLNSIGFANIGMLQFTLGIVTVADRFNCGMVSNRGMTLVRSN